VVLIGSGLVSKIIMSASCVWKGCASLVERKLIKVIPFVTLHVQSAKRDDKSISVRHDADDQL